MYLRQSDPKQVREHRESTARQYALRERAVVLGWAAESVAVIDEDLGQSGASAQWRLGFQGLAEDVAHARVGGHLSLEVARLARSSADWHRLLELCALADVVLIDEQSVYTPRDFNDRLLLGLKGTMSEAELYWMRLRLDGASATRRGAASSTGCPPPGTNGMRTPCAFASIPTNRCSARSACSSSASAWTAAPMGWPATSRATACPCRRAMCAPARCAGGRPPDPAGSDASQPHLRRRLRLRPA